MYNEQGWYKEVLLYEIICSATLTFSKEEAEIFNTIILICKHINKITAKYIYETYGLEESIAQKLLEILTNDLNLLEKVQNEDEVYYNVKKDILKQNVLLKEDIFYFQTPVRFFICLDPLLVSREHFTKKIPENLQVNEQIFNGLLKIDDLAKINNQTKKIYDIPTNFCGLNLSNGIKINGITQCTIKRIKERFILYKNKFKITSISKKHPNHTELKMELDSLMSNTHLLKKRIHEVIANILKSIQFSIDYAENTNELKVNIIEEYSNDKLGVLYQIINKLEGKTESIPMEGGWFFKIPLKLYVIDPRLNNWILLLKNLYALINNEYLSLINNDISAYKSKFQTIIDNITLDQLDTDFNPTIEDIQNIIKQVANYTKDEWFHLLYAKFLEKEVMA